MKPEDIKQLIFLAIAAILGLASTFVFDAYKNVSSNQRVLWDRDFDQINASKVCENSEISYARLVLRNTSKKNAPTKIIFDGEVSAAQTNPKQILQITSGTEGLSIVEIKDLKSRENVRLLVCGARYKSPKIEDVITGGKSQNFAQNTTTLKEYSFNDRSLPVRFIATIFGLFFMIYFIFHLGRLTGRKDQTSLDPKESNNDIVASE